MIAALAAACAALAVTTSGAAATGGSCSKGTADRLVNQDNLNDFRLPRPVVQFICGPFVGSGSRAMFVTIGAATCWGVQQWAVFAYRGGTWHLVTDRHVWVGPPPVAAVGGDIRVTSPVFAPGDSRCIPTAGTVTRSWRWNGSRFVLVGSARTRPAPADVEFYDRSLSRTIGCDMANMPRFDVKVVCQGYSSGSVQMATLGSGGQVTVCTQPQLSASGICNLGNLGDRTPTYGVGRQITVGPFRCQVLRTGVQCTVASTGRGFLFGAATVGAVGSAPITFKSA